MRWNGQGELECPLRGQSLESRLAAQRSVVQAVVERRSERSTLTRNTARRSAAWRDPRVLASVLGGLLLAVAIGAFAFSFVEFRWSQTASQALWIRLTVVFGAVAYVATWSSVVREAYWNVRKDLDSPPAIEPPALRCRQCGESYPSRYHFSETETSICTQCTEATSRVAERAQ